MRTRSPFDRAIELDNNHIGALVKKGQALSELQRYEEAITLFDRVTALDPERQLPILPWEPRLSGCPGTRMP